MSAVLADVSDYVPDGAELEQLSSGEKITVVKGKARTSRTAVPFVREPYGSETTIESQGKALLDAWGRWTRGDFVMLGMPRRWVTDKAGEGGIDAGSPKPPIVIPDEEAKTDKAVAILALRDKSILRRVIDLAFEQGLPTDQIAAELHCSRTDARNTIKRACRAIYRIRIAL